MVNYKLISMFRTSLINKNCPDKEQHMNVCDKLAVITGATSDVGRATADLLLKSKAKHVILTGINEKEGANSVKKLTEIYGEGTCSFCRADVTSRCDIENLFEKVASQGGPDILINNAACSCEKHWQRVIDVNYKGLIRCCLSSMKHLPDYEKERVVVNVSAVFGIDPLPYLPIYTATKSAVLGFHRSMGDDYHLNETNIRYVAILPGKTLSEGMNDFTKDSYLKEWQEYIKLYLYNMSEQQVLHAARGIVYAVEFGAHGDILMIEKSTVSRVTMPSRCSYSKPVVTFNSNVLRKFEY